MEKAKGLMMESNSNSNIPDHLEKEMYLKLTQLKEKILEIERIISDIKLMQSTIPYLIGVSVLGPSYYKILSQCG